jgi:hypothetical protein
MVNILRNKALEIKNAQQMLSIFILNFYLMIKYFENTILLRID